MTKLFSKYLAKFSNNLNFFQVKKLRNLFETGGDDIVHIADVNRMKAILMEGEKNKLIQELVQDGRQGNADQQFDMSDIIRELRGAMGHINQVISGDTNNNNVNQTFNLGPSGDPTTFPRLLLGQQP